jgi:tetratricopeptide (TPR) repeat protein
MALRTIRHSFILTGIMPRSNSNADSFSFGHGLRKGWRILFALSGAAMSISIGWIWLQPLRSQPAKKTQSLPAMTRTQLTPAVPQPTIDRLATEQQVLESRLGDLRVAVDAERDRLAALDDLARTMMTIAGLITIIIGAAAWKTVEDQRTLAEKGLSAQMKEFDQQMNRHLSTVKSDADRALRDMERAKSEIHQEFPMFGHMRRNFERVLYGLHSACQPLKPKDDAYRVLNWRDKQRVWFYERAMASSLLLEASQHASELAEIFRLLGVFYGSKYAVGIIDQKASSPVSRDDIDRAVFYFDRALELRTNDYVTVLHAGLFTMYPKEPELLAVSREYLQRAAVVGANKQRPLVNLTILELQLGNSGSALDFIDQAATRKEFDEPDSPPEPNTLLYLKACALAIKGNQAEEPRVREECFSSSLDLLEQVSNIGDEWIRNSFTEADLESEPDRDLYFSQVASNPLFAERFATVSVLLAR